MAEIGSVGFTVQVADDGRHVDDAKELEELGYSTIWLPGGQIDRPERVLDLLGATRSAAVGTAVLSAAVFGPDRVVALHRAVQREAPGRSVVLGLGGPQQRRSLAAVASYFDHLDAANPPVPPEDRMLAALGPRKLAVAARRSAGPILLLVTPDYLRTTRVAVGASTVVVGLFVVLDSDPARARAAARAPLGFLTGLPGYRDHLARLGYLDAQVRDVADVLVDDLVAWGSPEAVAERVDRLLQAGADHVFVQMVSDGEQPAGLDAARRLASHLTPLHKT
ncbi:MAG TPA: TIGR03620 family F420-dependent LLM class oxidoreductase [Pseudonocardia sp.]